MSNRNTPKYFYKIPLGNLTPEEFLTIAIEAAGGLGWDIGNIIESGFRAYPHFSMKPLYEEFSLEIKGGNAHLKSEYTGEDTLYIDRNEENIENFVARFTSLKENISTEELSEKQAKLKQIITELDEHSLDETPSPSKDESFGFLTIFKPSPGYFVTPLLIDLNILIYIIMVISGVNFFSPDSESLLRWGANFKPLTLAGEGWRLISCCFIHIGILHILMNMYALLYIGMLLEPYLGKLRFLYAYLLTGVTASMASLGWHDMTVSAGASGAIFGMYGVFLAMLTTNLIEKNTRTALLSSIAVFVGYNLLSGLKEGIDNAAHIGGLAGGILIGYSFIPGLKKPSAIRSGNVLAGSVGAFIILGTFIIYKNMPNDIATYDEKMKSFSEMEVAALQFYHLPDSTSKDKMLSELKDKGLYYWNENIRLLNELEKLKLPDTVHERNKLLLHYCELRIKTYRLLYKEINEDTNQYRDSIDYYYKGIDSTLAIINGPEKQ